MVNNFGQNVQPGDLDPTLDFIAGTIAGIAGVVAGFPFDTVKVRFQSPEISGRYRSTAHAFITIVREEKFVGLYKGIMSLLAGAALLNGLVFASYRFFMKIQLDSLDSTPNIYQIALAGAGSGVVSSIVVTPTELIKIRQQSLLIPTSAAQIALQIFRASGVWGLYRGMTATALRDCGSNGAYFAAYEATSRYLASASYPNITSDHSSVMSRAGVDGLSWPSLLIAGGIAGIAGWLFTFPFDVVKTRIQGSEPLPLRSPSPLGVSSVQSFTPTPAVDFAGTPLLGHQVDPYRSTISTFINLYHEEGVGVFFHGLAPTLIRAIPVNMATFATFEAIVNAF
ncbi:mitochondrial carrier domain-containing protein [Infundibulicybe gibba]|nr:mitochondrial carrier domain-containing protein [Infundibulicybe gibba]